MIHRPTLTQHMLKLIQDTNVLSPEDLKWCQMTISRTDAQDGISQLSPLVEMCNQYLKVRDTLSPWEDYEQQRNIANRVFAIKSLYYKQKRIMVAVPQRKKVSAEFDVINLAGLIAPQHVRLDVATVFNMGYAESRNYLVQKALTEGVYSHILFIDDDILLPLEAISRLVNANADIIGANYVKKNPLLESTVTTLKPNDKIVWEQSIVEPVQGSYSPVEVNCLGLGACLIDLDVFKKIPEPWFEFQYEFDEKGNRKRVLVGEDSRLCQKAMLAGIKPLVIPGLCCLHLDFKTGLYYGPEWLVDPRTRRVRPEYEDKYCRMAIADVKILAQPDNVDVFTFNQVK